MGFLRLCMLVRWRDGESAIELSIRTKSDAARSGYLKYPAVGEEDSYVLATESGRESSGEPDLDIVPELAPVDIFRYDTSHELHVLHYFLRILPSFVWWAIFLSNS